MGDVWFLGRAADGTGKAYRHVLRRHLCHVWLVEPHHFHAPAGVGEHTLCRGPPALPQALRFQLAQLSDERDFRAGDELCCRSARSCALVARWEMVEEVADAYETHASQRCQLWRDEAKVFGERVVRMHSPHTNRGVASFCRHIVVHTELCPSKCRRRWVGSCFAKLRHDWCGGIAAL